MSCDPATHPSPFELDTLPFSDLLEREPAAKRCVAPELCLLDTKLLLEGTVIACFGSE